MNSISNNTVQKRIKDWLDKQGYPLEMAVAERLRLAGITAVQSSFYLDTAANVVREIDVLAHSLHSEAREIDSINAIAEFETMMCIECKLSKDKPWVVFTSRNQRRSTKWVPDIVPVCSKNGLKYFYWLFRNSGLKQSFIFQPSVCVGYSLVQAFSDGADIPYKAVMGVVNAAKAKALEQGWSDENTTDGIYRGGRLVLPIVVFDNQLFECYLDAGGEPFISEVDSAMLQLDERQASVYGTHISSSAAVWIYTAKALDALVKDISELDDFIGEYMFAFMEQEIHSVA